MEVNLRQITYIKFLQLFLMQKVGDKRLVLLTLLLKKGIKKNSIFFNAAACRMGFAGKRE
jgi:hypothetical protein